MNWNRLDRLAILVLCLLPLAFFAPVIFFGQTFYFHDISIDYVPLNAFNTQTLRQGELPLWNPYLNGGFPFAGQPESAPLYPLNLILLLPLPITTRHAGYIVVHYALAGVFTYLLARRGLGLEAKPSFIAGAVFALSGTMVAELTNFTLVTTLAWMPLILLLYLRAVDEGKTSYAIGGGLALAVQISKSHPQMVLYTAGILALYALFVAVRGFREGQSLKALAPFKALTITLLVGAGLSAYQLLYSLELVQRSDRAGGITYEVMTILSYPPFYLIKFLIPNFFGSFQNYAGNGNFPEMHAYAGILPLILTVIAWRRSPDRRVGFFTVLLGLSVLFSFGRFTPLYEVLQYVPLFNFFRVPSRWLLLVTFSLAILAAYGAQALIEGRWTIKPAPQRGKWPAAAGLFAILLPALMAGGGGLLAWDMRNGPDACTLCWHQSFFGKPQVYAAYSALMEHKPEERDYEVVEPVAGQSFAAAREREAAAFQERIALAYADMQRSALRFGLMLSLGLGLVIARRQGWLGGRAFAGLAAMAVLLDLFSYGGVSLNPTTDASYFLAPPDTVRFLRQAKSTEPQRIFPTIDWVPGPDNTGYVLSTLNYNFPSLYGIESITGGATLPLKRHTAYMNYAIGPAGSEGGLKLLGIANTRYIVTEWDLEGDPNLTLVFEGKRQKIFQNRLALPRAFAVHRAEVLSNPEAILQRLAEPSFDPAQAVILEEPPAKPLPSGSPAAPPAVRIVRHAHNRVTMNVDLAETGLVFLSDVYYPGWRAYADGQQTPIYRANYLFRAVEVGPGQHVVEFRYEPLSFRIGLGISLLSAVIVAAWAMRTKVKRPTFNLHR
ncbi:MAG: YfhO family protein [Anaerolineae bacterium]